MHLEYLSIYFIIQGINKQTMKSWIQRQGVKNMVDISKRSEWEENGSMSDQDSRRNWEGQWICFPKCYEKLKERWEQIDKTRFKF